ncbi:MAG: TldD/PmbA family protein [Gemmatimonadetes bacterium]|nr:MAG: TldD/PmbA family protein [Gemmatimonadota bacterium]
MTDRREFLKHSALFATLCATHEHGRVSQLLGAAPTVPTSPEFIVSDPGTTELMMAALDAAKSGGANFADVRIGRQRQNFVFTRERQIQNVVDTDTLGCGVRALVDGSWGFAATRQLTKDHVANAAKQAVAIAKANRIARDQPVVLAPAPAHANVTWKSAYTVDPFTISVEEKTNLLLAANAAAMKAVSVKYVSSSLFFVKEERNYANSDGSTIFQTVIRSAPRMQITAVSADFTDFQNRQNMMQPMGRGWEYVLDCRMTENAVKWGEEAAAKLKAKPVDVGRYDLVLHPSNLWLTIHESIGHPTELDRAMGYEANYAGTSFLAPPEKMLGKFKYGPTIMNIQGDRSQAGALSTIGYDDDGVKPEDFLIIKNGVFSDYQTTREQATWLKWWYDKHGAATRSHGCSYSQGWADVQFQRMPNVSLLPGTKEQGWDDLIAATDRGIAIIGDGSFSIDQQRYNAQFGGQLFYEIRGGKIVGMLKDVAYQIRTPEFWNSLDMLGGKKSYELGGAFNDGKGQPGQSNAVSHGSVPARFSQVNVINTGRKA